MFSQCFQPVVKEAPIKPGEELDDARAAAVASFNPAPLATTRADLPQTATPVKLLVEFKEGYLAKQSLSFVIKRTTFQWLSQPISVAVEIVC